MLVNIKIFSKNVSFSNRLVRRKVAYATRVKKTSYSVANYHSLIFLTEHHNAFILKFFMLQIYKNERYSLGIGLLEQGRPELIGVPALYEGESAVHGR